MRAGLALVIGLGLLAGCKNDQGFTAFTGYPELETDHGQWLSMAVAPDGSPAISFYDRTHGALGFAVGEVRSNGIAWAYEEPDGYPDASGLDGGDVGTYTSLAFAPDGTAWVSYHAPGQGTLRVAHRVGRTWTSEAVDPGSGLRPETGLWTAIAIDAAGEPVVVYHDEVAGVLRLATRSGGAWSTETIYEGKPFSGTDAEGNPIERDADVGEYADILISGNTHYIAFYDKAQQELVLLEGFAGAYVPTIVDKGGVGAWPSLALDGDTLGIAYHDVVNQNLKLAVREGGGRFVLSTLDDGPHRGADTALFRRDGKWGAIYFDGRANDARLAKEGTQGDWSTEPIAGEDAAVGFHNEVVQDGAGRWWTASYDYTNRRIVAKRLE